MKKLLILLTFLLLIPFVASADTPSDKLVIVTHSPYQGFYGYAWLTDLPTVEKDKVLRFAFENGPEIAYYSETDSSKETAVFYIFAQGQLTGGVSEYTNESDYQNEIYTLTTLLDKPDREDIEAGYAHWSFDNTTITSADPTDESPAFIRSRYIPYPTIPSPDAP
jgi:hypothetical protein